ncbi:transcriptional regulator for cysteine regulon [mine drainage metagenome]|uniref:Transcriptional regulator for cysteine regulon n=1 Tax=mine drainage metagenome TaxID=410659 RepID=T1AWC8_9ZZZZ
MKLHQLRYLAAIAQSGLNITAAAQKLHTSQPGVSKQIKLLEDELGFQIFLREGRTLTRITPAGQEVIERALDVLQQVQSIRALSTELRDEGRGSLSIGTTHTQARYVLPAVIQAFRARYPNVRLNLHQGTSEQIAEMVAQDRIDCAIATGSEQRFAAMTLLPCYRWSRVVIVPRAHALARLERADLSDARRLPADHLHVQLQRTVLAERSVLQGGLYPQCRDHRTGCRRDRHLRATRPRGRYRGADGGRRGGR